MKSVAAAPESSISDPSKTTPPVFLFVSRITPVGGAERQVLFYADLLRNRGVPVTILAREIDFEHIRTCAPQTQYRTDVFRAIAGNPGCTVVSFLGPDHGFCAVLKLILGQRLRWIPFEQTHPDFYWKGFARSQGTRLLIKRNTLRLFYKYLADILLCQTDSAASSWRRILGTKSKTPVRIVQNVFTVSSVSKIREPSSMSRIVMIGRLCTAKDYPFALKVFEILKKRAFPFHLTVIGSGDLESSLKAEVARRGLQGVVEFVGLIRNAAQSLPKFDLFFMCSHVEGLPNALGEAMASGLPCVSLDFNAGPADLLGAGTEEGKAQIVSNRDPEATADRIVSILGDPDLMLRFGQFNRDRIAAFFSQDVIGSQFVNALASDE
jgi:glycosyltransferase involved in cell wall biosynthesis